MHKKQEENMWTVYLYALNAFYSCAPKLWNSLPADLRFCSSLDIFKKTLKTHLFKIAYDST